MNITREQIEAAYAALGLDRKKVMAVQITPDHITVAQVVEIDGNTWLDSESFQVSESHITRGED